ncbi:MAG: ribosome biogenesis GTP-binding protein YihA/YsxC [Acidimicrobiales bacterium]|nr:ribosome biogenesis GTP-binding protein YsxC [Acidimicrobiales bacterium]MCB1250433.1 ribosome biogenesis GTP-binding protein YsxC [Acidimicrobiales bacterium]
MASPPLRLRFLTSAPDLDHLPPTRAEVTVLGRSNVGKSSLLNALSGGKDVAKTSKKPGRTRLLNAFALDEDATVVDCPGYGYAQVSKAERAAWQDMVDDYLLGRDELMMAMVLVDGEVGPTKLDVAELDWLREHRVPHTVVATKHDKVRSAKRERRKRDLAAGCGLERGDIVWVSAHSGVGIDRLRDLVRLWVSPPPR